jgi:hypothetical protein
MDWVQGGTELRQLIPLVSSGKGGRELEKISGRRKNRESMVERRRNASVGRRTIFDTPLCSPGGSYMDHVQTLKHQAHSGPASLILPPFLLLVAGTSNGYSI